MAVAPLACLLAVATVTAGGCSGCLRAPVERIDTSPRTLSGPQLYVTPGGSDDGECSSADPCRQLERADALAAPGTTINVAPGTYAPATLRASGTRSEPIRFLSTERWAATILNTGTSPGPILSVHGSHVEVAGFEITSNVSAEVDGISLTGSYSRAVGNLVHDLVRPCGSNGGIIAGDAAYASHDMEIIGNYVHDIGEGPRDGSCSLLHGIYAAVPRVVIANNVVVRALGDGITSWHAATRLKVVNNTVVANGQDGILIGNGDAGGTEEGNTGTYVANNILAFNHGDAISEGGPRSVSNTVAANIFYGNGRDIFDQWGGSAESSTLKSDPLFADAATDHLRPLRGSPALGSGTVIGAPTTDFLGAPRATSITRGAFQDAVPDP
jgi:hypothetical protein